MAGGYVAAESQARIDRLEQGEKLYLTLELTNPVTALAVQIQTTDYRMLGWAPNYLVYDLAAAAESPREYEAEVVRVNPQPSPSRQRVLIEMRGRWDEHEPIRLRFGVSSPPWTNGAGSPSASRPSGQIREGVAD